MITFLQAFAAAFCIAFIVALYRSIPAEQGPMHDPSVYGDC